MLFICKLMTSALSGMKYTLSDYLVIALYLRKRDLQHCLCTASTKENDSFYSVLGIIRTDMDKVNFISSSNMLDLKGDLRTSRPGDMQLIE